MDPSLKIFDAVHDPVGLHLHLMHLFEEVPLLVELVTHSTRKEAMPEETYGGKYLQTAPEVLKQSFQFKMTMK